MVLLWTAFGGLVHSPDEGTIVCWPSNFQGYTGSRGLDSLLTLYTCMRQINLYRCTWIPNILHMCERRYYAAMYVLWCSKNTKSVRAHLSWALGHGLSAFYVTYIIAVGLVWAGSRAWAWGMLINRVVTSWRSKPLHKAHVMWGSLIWGRIISSMAQTDTRWQLIELIRWAIATLPICNGAFLWANSSLKD